MMHSVASSKDTEVCAPEAGSDEEVRSAALRTKAGLDADWLENENEANNLYLFATACRIHKNHMSFDASFI